MQDVQTLAVPSVVGKLTGAKVPHTEALNIIEVRKVSKRKRN
jgi:hypothetical protein